MQRVLGMLLMALLTAALLGCGSKKPDVYKVTGKVTFDGKPLADARVTFHAQGKGSPRKPGGTTDEDGNVSIEYVHSLEKTLEGAPLGEYKVTIAKVKSGTVDSDEEDSGDDEAAEMAAMELTSNGVDPTAPESLIPTKYGDVSYTPFSVTVKETDNTFNLELKSDFE